MQHLIGTGGSALASFLATLALTPLVRAGARATGFVAPVRRDRFGCRAVALGGGAAMALAVALVLATTPLGGALPFSLQLALLGIALLGLWDDLKPLSPCAKLIPEVLLAMVAVRAGVRHDWLGVPLLDDALVVLWIVGITNATNLIDGMDGVAGSVLLVTLGAIGGLLARSGAWPEAALAAVAFGAVGGFLLFNRRPASIYMGDCGALSLGFLLACLAVLAVRSSCPSPSQATVGLVLLALVPLTDITFVVVTRIARGRSPFRGGCDHLAHRLARLGVSQSRVVLLHVGCALASCLSAVALPRLPAPVAFAVIAVFLVGAVLLTARLSRTSPAESPLPSDR